ncbi:MAG: hypothetical protein KGZ74_14580 [Chitinophagaceae bacterium]|nr:hypothetical protein [Chitinophagaceae bacterium]
MTDMNQIQDQLNLEESDLKTLPQGLNVLTILTYIGSALQLISGLVNYFTIASSYKIYEGLSENAAAAEKNPFSSVVSAASETVKKQYENRTLIMVITVLGAIACFYGAMQMRKRKMQGYNIYVGGEIVPPIVNMVIIGMGGLGFLGAFGLVIPIVFIILYTLQRKYLTH